MRVPATIPSPMSIVGRLVMPMTKRQPSNPRMGTVGYAGVLKLGLYQSSSACRMTMQARQMKA